MTSDDLSKIQKVLKTEINTALDNKLADTEKRLKTEITSTQESLRFEITSTEKRLRAEIGLTEKHLRGEMGSLKAEVVASEKRVISEIVDFVQDQLMPLIDDKADKKDIDNSITRTDFLSDKVGEHDVRLKNIESIKQNSI